ncbi:ribonuclease D [uncultured Sphingosinicella sp.]|uniref:ribonuclease D n=1 Tax=uncultured Sphingosinicella sp. TaxID=478748 RepID=UPI0030DAD443|tara:strand:- start:9364 stop:10527 length:1164 start_codon:yes stop_codon:yes gene_type:complete
MKIHPLITDTETLAAFCARLAAADYVAVDTEFMRENTYWADLCLIQLASPDEAAAVDPKASGLDLAPMLDLLVEADVLKIFHAGGQDIEIIHNMTGKTPSPVFDTQVAAMALGMGEQVSYINLVASFTGANLDKGARFTDWARRPLDKRQLDYAIGDVTHLIELFPKLLGRLKKTGRGDWLDEEMARLTTPENYVNDPWTAWQRIRLPSRKAEALGRLKALAAWRELEAQRRDLPRGRIVKDETLADLAAHPPGDQEALGRVRGLSKTWTTNDMGARLMEALEAAVPLPESEMPERDAGKPRLGSDSVLVADLLKLLLKIRCKEADVAPKLIGKADHLEALAAGVREGLPLLNGWRYEVFGRDALALVEGRLSFAVQNGKLRMTGID